MDSIRELIMKNLVSTLEGVTEANGYSNTIQDVRRFDLVRKDFSALPAIEITAIAESESDSPTTLVSKELTVLIDVHVNHDKDTHNMSTDEYLNTFVADITKILRIDETRGGNAIDTRVIHNSVFARVDGMPGIGITFEIEIPYRHRRDNPYSLT